MKSVLAWLLALTAATAMAQEGRRAHGPGRWHPAMQQPMPSGPGMSWEERQRLRDELKGMRREPPRDGARMTQADPRRPPPPPMPPEERERLRRDLRDANRDLGGRR